MGEVSIPSVISQSNNDWNKQIEGLLEKERIPVTRLEGELESYKTEKRIWSDIRQQINQLAESASSLYQFGNPFSERAASSENDKLVSATVKSGTALGKYSISVDRLATSDRLISKSVSKDFVVPDGLYHFRVGKEDIRFLFNDKSLTSFVERLNSESKGLIRSFIIQENDSNRLIALNSMKTGQDNRLQMLETAQEFAQLTGLLGQKQDVSPELMNIDALRALNPQLTASEISEQSITLPQNLSARIPLQSGEVPLEFTVSSPEVDVQLQSGDSSRKLAVRQNGKLEIPAQLPDDAILLVTSLSSQITISNPTRVQTTTTLNYLEEAGNAQFTIDQIPLERSENIIDNVIPALTLELHKTTSVPVEINIEPDSDAAKNAIIQFVGRYNQTMQMINVLTRDRPEVIEDITYLTSEEKTEAEERLGKLLGDRALNRLAYQLQNTMRSGVRANSSVPMLESLGIRSKAFSRGAGERNSLYGYLEINEETLDSTLKNNYSDVAQLFGYDNNNDLVIDSGIAYDVDAAVKEYVQSGGIINNRVNRIDSLVEDTETQITRYNVKITDLERELVEQFTRLEQQIRLMEQNTNTLQNLNPNQNR